MFGFGSRSKARRQAQEEFDTTCRKLRGAPELAQIGVVSRNRRNFRHTNSSPATSASRSNILPSLWKV